ncbi:abc atp-binding protein isoform 1 [Ceraceosorus bombacis]|uniref:Abc atp-binding protein isoform 1 n=1 Tax=Ceraceosorus bombacis TaxID=401625 RepID=A0A0P1BF84_9BASI|nr:abc atp-binding protein isoform 1 [Ceraceosorus bombacis]
MTSKDVSLSWHDLTFDIPIPRKTLKAQAQKAQVEQQRSANAASADVEKSAKKSESSADGVPPAATPTLTATNLADGHRRLLDSVSGSVRRGEMVAILGASGAGKTTLLNVLSARLSKLGNLDGQVLFNGKSRDPATWKRTVGFVEQDDLMFGTLTVHEQISYSARMRLPDSMYDRQTKMDRVEDIIRMLRLEKCRDSRIGDARTRGISGGERKRTSIGVELVSDVSLLLLDEPTSGLDAFAAHSVVENLRNTTKEKNLSCLMTIHQPSWALLCLYDRIQLLAQGRVYYEGPPRETLAWFDSLGYQVPEGTNPADHYITLAENPGNTAEGAKRIDHLISAWHERARSGASTPAVALTDASQTKRSSADLARDGEMYRHWPASWLSELAVLTERNWLQLIRDVPTIIAVVGQTVILLIIIGFAFFRLGYDQGDVLARIGVLFFLPINSTFSVFLPVLAPLALQRAVMKRERSAGTYRTSSFYMSKMLIEVPSNAVQRIPFFAVLYWMCGLNPSAASFFIFLALNLMQVIVATCLGLFIGSVSPTIELANIIAPLISVIFLLFGGNLLPSPPPWFVWLRWISPITEI